MKIIVTDLTKFNKQGLVCLAGINVETGECVRPFLTNKDVRGDYLHFDDVKEHKIIPGSYLEGDFIKRNSAKPHTEGHLVPQLKLAGQATSDEFKAFLEKSSATTIATGFGSNLVNKFYAIGKEPPISIFTLKCVSPRTQFELIADGKYGPPSFKAHVTDAAGVNIRYLKVKDIGFSEHINKVCNDDPDLNKLNAFLKRQDVLYLRIGLAQAYSPDGQAASCGYYPQLNGIYSFPDFREDLRIYD